MRRSTSLFLLLLLLAWGLFSGLYGLTTRDLHAWDEGVYYDEARYVVQAARLAPGVLGHRVSPAEAREGLVALPPRMGRPVNVALNAAAIAVVGERVWAPGLVAVLAGVLCLWLTFTIMRRLAGEGPALLAMFFLAFCPYFLTYRRLGLPEAAATAAALLVVWLVVKGGESERGRGGEVWRSVGLGVLAGVAFGINLRVLMLLPWVMVWRSVGRGRQWWVHAVGVGTGFVAMLGVYELPYLVGNKVLGRFGFELEGYFAQLKRFTIGQQGLRPELGSGYVDWAWMAGHYGPVVVMAAVVGLVWAWRARNWGMLKVASVVVLPMMQMAVLIPYLRYNSWLAPVAAMLGAYGVWGLWEGLTVRTDRDPPLREGAAGSRERRHGRRYRVVAAVAIVFLVSVGISRGIDCWMMLGSRSNERAALVRARELGAEYLLTTNLSAVQAHAPLFTLEVSRQMEMAPEVVLRELRSLVKQGRTLVVVEGHQFMNGAVMMSPEEYEASAAGAIVREGRVLWEAPHLRGMTLWLFLEHNKTLRETLGTYRAENDKATRIMIYDGLEALRIIEQNVHANVKRADNNGYRVKSARSMTTE